MFKSGSGILAFDTTGNKQELGIYQIQWFEEEKIYTYVYTCNGNLHIELN